MPDTYICTALLLNYQLTTTVCRFSVAIPVSMDEDLEFADVIVDVVQVGHHHALVLHHFVQHGQPVRQLGPGLVELSQRRRFRHGTSR